MFAYSDFSEAWNNAILHTFISILLAFIIYNITSEFIPINPIFQIICLIFGIGASLTGIGTLIKMNEKDSQETDSSSSLGKYLLKYESATTIIQLIIVLLIIGHILFYGERIKNLKKFANYGYNATKGAINLTAKVATQPAKVAINRTAELVKKNLKK